MSELATRPTSPVVGVSMQHEAADLHVTGLALYTDDLVNRHVGVLHAYPVQARTPTRTSRRCAPSPRWKCRAWCACSPRPTCPA